MERKPAKDAATETHALMEPMMRREGERRLDAQTAYGYAWEAGTNQMKITLATHN